MTTTAWDAEQARRARWAAAAAEQRARAEEFAERTARAAAEARAAMAPVTDADADIVLALVRHVDRDHDVRDDFYGCHATVPDHCADYCRACATLRGVRDDVLLAARAQATAEGAAR